MTNLNVKALLAVFILAVAIALLLFVSAGTVDYWQAWVYLSIFFLVSLLTTLYLMRNDPELLKRRMSGGPTAEKRPAQRIIMLFTSLGFIALLFVPGLDRRFGWSSVPPYVVIFGDLLVIIGFYLIFLVYRENTYTSATIQVVADQRVVSTGPYAIVRHPMYAGALLYLLGTPLALGSYWGLLAYLFIVPFLVWRLFDEEKTLVKELPGYAEYRQRVRNRILPTIW
jgi:protein-S-isoprenylcysteine O-methyltransferase Ste14